MPPLTAQLDQYHAQVVCMLEHASALFEQPANPEPGAFAETRAAMLDALMAYQRFKHAQLFEPLIADGTPDDQRLAGSFKAECIQLGEEIRRFTENWPAEAIQPDWPEYRLVARAMMRRIRRHIAVEREQIDAMLAAQAERSRHAA